MDGLEQILIESPEFQQAVTESPALRESVTDIMLRLDDVKWNPILAMQNEGMGPKLDALKQLSAKLSDMTPSNPLLRQADQLRSAYAFGNGLTWNNLPKQGKTSTAMNDPHNRKVLFSRPAWEEMNRAIFTTGNYFCKCDTSSSIPKFTAIPLTQITGVMVDPDDTSTLWFIRRTWPVVDMTGSWGQTSSQEKTVWYPIANSGYPTKLRTINFGGPGNAEPIDRHSRVYHRTGYREPGWIFGVPDALAAVVWCKAYTEYLENNSLLVRAYSRLAMKMTTPTRKTAQKAASVVNSGDGVGGTAVLPDGAELAPVPPTGSDVDFNNGRPLAAMVATSLGVSVVALLSDPGVSGAAATAETLDAPTAMVMTSIQQRWREFFNEILDDLGGQTVTVSFPAIQVDPVYRQVNSLLQAYTSGAITQEEWRDKILDLLDIQKISHSLPIPDMFNGGHAILADKDGVAIASDNGGSNTSDTSNDKDTSQHDPVPSQGNTGSAGSVDDNSNDLRDNGDYDN